MSIDGQKLIDLYGRGPVWTDEHESIYQELYGPVPARQRIDRIRKRLRDDPSGIGRLWANFEKGS